MSFSEDLVAAEKQQQELLRVKLDGLREFVAALRQAVFDDLRRYLAAHVAAEQVWADPTSSPRPVGVDADTTRSASVNLPMHEAATHIGEVVAAMEAVPVDSPQFNAGIERLVALVDAHVDVADRQIEALLRTGGERAAEELLFAINAVPMMSRGEGHAVDQVDHFTYRDRFDEFRTAFQVMPRPHD